MKTTLTAAACAALFFASAALSAEDTAPLGRGHVAVKLDYIAFTDSIFDQPEGEEDGLYLGIEGYWSIYPNLYLGGEVGGGSSIDLFGSDVDYGAVELNLKYALEPNRNFVIDFGGGLSYNYVELDFRGIFQETESIDDWVFGAQVFAAASYKIDWFIIGLNAKYQLTDDFKDSDTDLSNYRVGVHVGAVF